MDRTTRRARLFRRDDGLVALHQTPPSRRNWQAYKCYRGFIEQLANAHAASNSPHSIYKELDIQGNDEILKLFFAGDIHEKERKYYEFIKNRAENEQLLPGFSRDLQEIWENYLDG